MSGGALIIAAGHQMMAHRDSPEAEVGLFEAVARQNCPLDLYHPQLMLQCLLWGTSLLSPERIRLTESLTCRKDRHCETNNMQSRL